MTATGRERQGPAWPGLRASAAYEGGTESISAARGFCAGFLRRAEDEHGVRVPPRALAEAQLVVSELVTNACKYAPGPTALGLELRDGVLQITVRDSGTTLPVVAGVPEPGRIGQHGLEIVFALCDGFDVHRESAGKRITVSLALHAHDADTP